MINQKTKSPSSRAGCENMGLFDLKPPLTLAKEVITVSSAGEESDKAQLPMAMTPLACGK